MVTISALLVWKLSVLFMYLLYHICTEKYRKTCNFSEHFQPGNRPVRLWLLHAQALHEPPVLLGSERPGFAFLSRPLEAARLQTLVQQQKSVAFPIQRFDAIPTTATEQKQCVCKRIQRKLLLDQSGQTVNPTAQVRIAAGNVDFVRAREAAQHDFSTRSTFSTVAASAPL